MEGTCLITGDFKRGPVGSIEKTDGLGLGLGLTSNPNMKAGITVGLSLKVLNIKYFNYVVYSGRVLQFTFVSTYAIRPLWPA